MAANIAIDTVIGSVPILGDLFDAGWKSNQRNLVILERHIAEPTASKQSDRAFVLLLGGGLLVVSVAVVVAAMLLSAKVIRWLLTQA